MSQDSSDRAADVALLLNNAGLPPADRITAMAGGRNNKVFRVDTSAGPFLFKAYFHHPEDPRDRLAQEFAFLEHLASRKSRFAAAPIASDPARHIGLMEFLHGERPSLGEVDAHHIREAVAFFFDANRDLQESDRFGISLASEACFSVAEHVTGTRKRIARLEQMLESDDVDREAIAFVRHELLTFWETLDAAILDAAGAEVDERILEAECCLSPSDFGFHNSLRQPDGTLKFLDFEYAGWDDPAKLIIDFANQPDMILPQHLELIFREAVIAAATDPGRLRRRVELLEPVYQTKWACICLNDFLAFGRTRHRFTEGERSDHRARRIFQLSRARTMLARAQRTPIAAAK